MSMLSILKYIYNIQRKDFSPRKGSDVNLSQRPASSCTGSGTLPGLPRLSCPGTHPS